MPEYFTDEDKEWARLGRERQERVRKEYGTFFAEIARILYEHDFLVQDQETASIMIRWPHTRSPITGTYQPICPRQGRYCLYGVVGVAANHDARQSLLIKH